MRFVGQRQKNNYNLVSGRHSNSQGRNLSQFWILLQSTVVPSLLLIIKTSKRVQTSDNKGGKKEEEEPSTVSFPAYFDAPINVSLPRDYHCVTLQI